MFFSLWIKHLIHTVSLQVIELLLVPKPSIEKRNKLITQIANGFGFNWDPISVIDNASSAYEDPMSHIEIHSMLMLFNKIPCSNNKQFEISTCKSLLEKTIVDAQSLINTKEKKMDDMRESIFQLLVYRDKIEAYTVAEYLLDQKNLCRILRYITYFSQQIVRHLPYIESRRYVLNLNIVY